MEENKDKPSNPRMTNPDGMYASEARTEDYYSLRDYFAGQAVCNYLTYKPKNIYQSLRKAIGLNWNTRTSNYDDVAKVAYSLADEMLKKRSA